MSVRATTSLITPHWCFASHRNRCIRNGDIVAVFQVRTECRCRSKRDCVADRHQPPLREVIRAVSWYAYGLVLEFSSLDSVCEGVGIQSIVIVRQIFDGIPQLILEFPT